jgi:hypothetical protein
VLYVSGYAIRQYMSVDMTGDDMQSYPLYVSGYGIQGWPARAGGDPAGRIPAMCFALVFTRIIQRRHVAAIKQPLRC